MFFCYNLFAQQKNQEKQYEAHRKDTMVNGKTTTNFVPLPGRVLCYPIDQTRKAFAEGEMLKI